eukprot:scaffold1310_cov128-Skeletonema_dohrnii-CCMP3373.AAC.7
MARRYLITAAAAVCIIILASVPSCCQSFTAHATISKRRNASPHLQMIFRDLVSNDEIDLRVSITSIQKKDDFEKFLQEDDRLCVIKFYAPFCKACKAFGKKFRKLAIDRGDPINSIGEVARHGDARFGEIEQVGNSKLVKELGIKKFPTVLIYRGSEKLSEITCKNDAIEKITAEMDSHLTLR